ncbi:MAG: eukaryotic-like serine/threonine-protein kinase [Acidobacteriota bacterium]|jgi:serine/threonine protein kinase|nr:eukaryotic-like serine/threonine-protein kinase [Acidobacteriota bacterium]
MPEDTAPAELGHYRILSPLGAGGMGEVFLATDTRLNRNVAIKVLPSNIGADEEAQRRMLREARLVATIDHPNVCTIFEIGTDHDRPFIVMQYIQGETLSQRMHRGALSLAETIDIARQITSGLAEAHARGIVHRDIKPGNIMISSSGIVKVLDFGLAKSFAREANEATEVIISTPGLVAGTGPYMSPEQLLAEPLDGRSDIFSLGIVLYEIASGRRPFDRATVAGTISAILVQAPPPLENSELSALEPLIRRALEKQRDQRFPTAAAMHEALGAIGTPRKRKSVRDAAAPKSTRREKPPSTKRQTKSVKLPPDPAAEKLCLRGRSQWNKRHPEAIRQAIALFQEAADVDPMHAGSYAGLADAYVMLAFLQVIPPRDVIPKARASALKAIALEPELAEPHATLGYLAAMFEWDWPTAERELKEAMRLDPAYPWAPHWYGLVVAPKSIEESRKYVTLARELDPLSPIIQTAVGINLHLSRDYPAALRIYTQILDTETAFAPAHYYIGLTYEQLGEYELAITNLRRAAEIAGRGWLFLGALGHCYGISGQHELAHELLREVGQWSRDRYISPSNVMLIHLGLGDAGATFEWFERALDDRASWLWHTPLEPRFDRIRDDARFRELVARYGLAQRAT